MAWFRATPLAAMLAVLSTASGAGAAVAPAAPAGDPVAGGALFKARCGICHTIVNDGKPAPGPLMLGLVGRKAASVPGFTYSPALKATKITWTPALIDKFITAPQVMVPGTFMVISVPKPDERADVIAYLATLKK